MSASTGKKTEPRKTEADSGLAGTKLPVNKHVYVQTVHDYSCGIQLRVCPGQLQHPAWRATDAGTSRPKSASRAGGPEMLTGRPGGRAAAVSFNLRARKPGPAYGSPAIPAPSEHRSEPPSPASRMLTAARFGGSPGRGIGKLSSVGMDSSPEPQPVAYPGVMPSTFLSPTSQRKGSLQSCRVTEVTPAQHLMSEKGSDVILPVAMMSSEGSDAMPPESFDLLAAARVQLAVLCASSAGGRGDMGRVAGGGVAYLPPGSPHAHGKSQSALWGAGASSMLTARMLPEAHGSDYGRPHMESTHQMGVESIPSQSTTSSGWVQQSALQYAPGDELMFRRPPDVVSITAAYRPTEGQSEAKCLTPDQPHTSSSWLPAPSSTGSAGLFSGDNGNHNVNLASKPCSWQSPGGKTAVETTDVKPEPTFASVHLLLSSLNLSAPGGRGEELHASPGAAIRPYPPPSAGQGPYASRSPSQGTPRHGAAPDVGPDSVDLPGPYTLPPPPRQPKNYGPAQWRSSQLEAMKKALSCGISLNQAFSVMGVQDADGSASTGSGTTVRSPARGHHSSGDGAVPGSNMTLREATM